jgi:hypothetical protein
MSVQSPYARRENPRSAPPSERRAPASRQSKDGAAAIMVFVLLIGAVLYWAWTERHSGLIDPRRGGGYALGIIGASLMLALLLYPLRKRLKSMRNWGRVAVWFRVHMILGVVGPTLIILHSNFQVKSANAAVALYSMLIVAGSGVIGRYLYARIHRGLYGNKVEVRELLAEASAFRESLGEDLAGAVWRTELERLERDAMAPARGFFSALGRSLSISARAEHSRKAMLRDCVADVRRIADRKGWSNQERRRQLAEAKARVADYYAAIRRAAGLAVYERLFAAWHVLHLPLFFMLILTAVIHVVAVHMY